MPFNFRELKKDEEVICLYIGYLKNVGAFKRPVFVFREETGKQFHIWGTVMFNMLMWGIPFGSRIKIKYLGLKDGDKTKHKLKSFEIEIIDTERVKKLPRVEKDKQTLPKGKQRPSRTFKKHV